MKPFLNTLLEGLTYKDLAGRRRLRSYTVTALLILFLLLMVGALACTQRQRVLDPIEADPLPVALTEESPAPTQEFQAEDAPAICPSDPAEWSLVDVFSDSRYKSIQPACVYEGLERTVAWTLAVRSGYSRMEAAQLLGFPELPMARLEQARIPSDPDGFQEVAVSFIPPHPDFAEWRLTASGEAAITLALRGCYRTSDVVGGQRVEWGGGYPVICLVVEDAENAYAIYALDGHVFTMNAAPMRSLLLFGYAGNGPWVWLGTQESPRVEISDPASNARERQTVAELYGSGSWDTGWLEARFGLTEKPLPVDWQSYTNESEGQIILTLLNENLEETDR